MACCRAVKLPEQRVEKNSSLTRTCEHPFTENFRGLPTPSQPALAAMREISRFCRQNRGFSALGHQPDPGEIALADLQDALETGREHPLRVLDDGPIHPNCALAQLAGAFGIAGGQSRRLK